ncbi:crossover junction endonuclease MUS81-like [Copidosoma floridanum]|uniref:crossover junction endonuclease MUS81-like n=1 Tax=Copidosoma floridanum TaxID=29053 RepID=UPI000C6FBE28|nr:crossover junction endonuclease MUS81-like [Copidosoma floridanum]
MNFTKFNSAAKKTKSFTVREMFMRQLLQLKGISVDKAMAITNVYPTPKTLTHAFKNEDDNLLANIPLGTSKSRIGPVISRNLSQFYSRPSFN